MSKAEKFIQDYTRNCSNEIQSPYPQIVENICKIDGEPAKEFSPWLTPDQAKKAVEIAREEIIEKVCSFIVDNISEYIELKHANPTTFIEIDGDRFATNLKQAMRDE